MCKALERHLEEMHMTWAQFWKKLDKMGIWLEDRLKNQDQSVETASGNPSVKTASEKMRRRLDQPSPEKP
ncbi:hypothetical protein Tco_1513899 [Tanacetum coccineum]